MDEIKKKIGINGDTSTLFSYDSWGRVTSASYYSTNNQLIKQEFYVGEKLSKIDYYHKGVLYKTELYNAGIISSKIVYKKDGSEAYCIKYNDSGRVKDIYAQKDNKYLVSYEYDKYARIISRKWYINDTLKTVQMYCYDDLNRITEYKDNNQTIEVSEYGKKHELIAYTITDKIGNKIFIKNNFSESGYVDSEITSGYEHFVIKDISYAHNIMLRKPRTSDDDLDFIIANLFNSEPATTNRTEFNDIISRTTPGLNKNSISPKVLPISIRKRVLYDLLAKNFTNQK